MEGRYEALSLVVRAMARAAAERDEHFAMALGSKLRSALCGTAVNAEVFEEVFAWLAAFERATVHPAADGALHPPS